MEMAVGPAQVPEGSEVDLSALCVSQRKKVFAHVCTIYHHLLVSAQYVQSLAAQRIAQAKGFHRRDRRSGKGGLACFVFLRNALMLLQSSARRRSARSWSSCSSFALRVWLSCAQLQSCYAVKLLDFLEVIHQRDPDPPASPSPVSASLEPASCSLCSLF